MDLESIQRRIRPFRDERDWMQFHNPKNLAISISLEASELLEHFQWKSFEESERHVVDAKGQIADEIADIAVYLIEICDNIGVDLESAIHAELDKNADKYPADKARGSSRKHSDLKGPTYAASPSAVWRFRRPGTFRRHNREPGRLGETSAAPFAVGSSPCPTNIPRLRVRLGRNASR